MLWGAGEPHWVGWLREYTFAWGTRFLYLRVIVTEQMGSLPAAQWKDQVAGNGCLQREKTLSQPNQETGGSVQMCLLMGF